MKFFYFLIHVGIVSLYTTPITTFDPVDPRQALPAMEAGILRYWKEEDIFKRSVKQRDEAEHFSFYDGPPFATGLPHYGHLLAGTIKDVIPRYQTMRGKRVERRFGWDCHGLPVENLIEKEHKISSHKEIEKMGVKKFNELCSRSVQRYTKEWREIVERMGRWVDMDWDYRTMDPEYMESIWWVFSELYKKGLIYEGHKPMHICPRCVTPLSNFEVTQGYKDVTDVTVTVKFQLKNDSGASLLAWTTTPCTLPGNLFLAVDPKMVYVKLKIEDGQTVIFSKDVYERSKNKHANQEVLEELKGKKLLGKKYEPLFPYFEPKYADKEFSIVEGDFVTADEGTGIVHIAPGFGEDDFNLGKREGVEVLQHVTMDGKFIPEVTDFAGLDVKPINDPSKTDKKVIAWLEQHGKLFAKETHTHSYPHCWRCDSPLLNYATSSWFVAVEKIKEDLLNANAKTEWVPAHVRDGRFGKWLEGARDWAISRNRFWGTPLPIWQCEETGEIEVIGSRDDLMKHAPTRFTKVTAIRHGESKGNLTPIYQGKLPGTDLTANGKKQVKELSKRFKPEQIATIYCSPLARTVQTAEILAKATGAEVIIDDRLREISFGEYEGKTIDFSDLSFVKARRAHKLEVDSPESIYHFPGMETWSQTQKRIDDFLSNVLPKHRGEHILIVTHADPIRNITHFFTREDPMKLSHQPYPKIAEGHTFFWDQEEKMQLDLHKHIVDEMTWEGSSGKTGVEVTLVRHGETDWNKEKKIQGQADTAMNETGKKQAEELTRKLSDKKFDCIVSSALRRSIETAEILSKKLEIPFEEQWEELNERDFGDWEGRTRSEVDPTVKGQFSIQNIDYPNGETLEQFLNRITTARVKLINKFSGKRVLVVAHGGVLKAMRVITGSLTLEEAQQVFTKNAECITFKLHPQFKRIPEVFDCWFESGSMPYAQPHFPFETSLPSPHGRGAGGEGKKKTNSKQISTPQGFPADFIAEGMDQTRGWFYTLMVLSTALFKEPAFKHCVVNGIVLAEDGKKMSKRLKNYPEPMELTEKYGADAVRFTLMSSPAVRGEDLRFSEKMVAQSMRNVLLPLWNSYSFFVTYANAAKFEPVETRKESTHPLDVWIHAEIQDLVNRMTEQLDRYELSFACSELDDTIDALTNWYIRLSRRRFAGKDAEDQFAALSTLYDVLLTMSQLLAPFCPFLSDAIYLNLVPEDHGSVHLTDWPGTKTLAKKESALLEKTRIMRLIVSLGHSVRSGKNIKVRQPLGKAIVALPPSQVKTCNLSEEDLALIRQELNVKELAFANDPKKLADVIVKVDARKVGPRLPNQVQEIIQAGKNGDFTLQDDGSVLIREEVLTPEEAEVVYLGKEGLDVAANKGVVVSIDTTVTKELKGEGIARDLIRTIQRLRKESGLKFTDRIALELRGADEILHTHRDLIEEATRSSLKTNSGEEHIEEIGGKNVTIRFTKM